MCECGCVQAAILLHVLLLTLYWLALHELLPAHPRSHPGVILWVIAVPFEKNLAGVWFMQNRAVTLPGSVLELCRNALYFTQEPFADTPVILRWSF
jgi:hypothetical protein